MKYIWILLLVTMPAHAYWTPATNLGNGSVSADNYYDPDNITVENGKLSYWIKMDRIPAGRIPHSVAKSALVKAEINCITDRFRLVYIEEFSENGLEGKVLSSIKPDTPWKPIEAGSGYSQFRDSYCQY